MRHQFIGVVVCILLICILLCGCGSSEELSMDWSNNFGGQGNDRASAVQETIDGGYIIVGYTTSYGAGEKDIWIVKVDIDGEEEWSKTIGYIGNDIAMSVVQTSDTGYIIAGETAKSIYGQWKQFPYLLKVDANGDEQWSKIINDFTSGAAYTVRQTSDDGYIICGGAGVGWLAKLDVYGKEQWSRTFVGLEGDTAYSVRQTMDGGYIIAGETESDTAGWHDAWIIKTDGAGTEEWSKKLGGKWEEMAYAIEQTADGGYILVGKKGTCCNFIGWNWDLWICKVDENGVEEWTKTLGGPGMDWATSVIQTVDGGYIVVGTMEPDEAVIARARVNGSTRGDAWLVKLDEAGNLLWDQTFSDSSAYIADIASCIQQTQDGGYVVAGTTKRPGSDDSDFWILKLGDSGERGPY